MGYFTISCLHDFWSGLLIVRPLMLPKEPGGDTILGGTRTKQTTRKGGQTLNSQPTITYMPGKVPNHRNDNANPHVGSCQA